MSERTKIEVTDPKALRAIWELYGAANVAEKIKATSEKWPNLSGLGMALAIAEREVAECRVQLSMTAIRVAARAGHDVGSVNVYTSIGDNGRPMIEVEPFDLVDRAQEG